MEQMTPDQQRKIIEAAAKACGACRILAYTDDGIVVQWSPILRGGQLWNPIDITRDTGWMCAKLDINTFFYLTLPRVECSVRSRDPTNAPTIRYTINHDGTDAGKEAAQRLAASMVAAKAGGYTE